MPLELVTSEQIKAARIFLHMSAQDLADSAGVGIATIKRIEAVDGVPQANIRTLQLIVKN